MKMSMSKDHILYDSLLKLKIDNKLYLGEGQEEKSQLVSVAIKVQEIVLVIKLFHILTVSISRFCL